MQRRGVRRRGMGHATARHTTEASDGDARGRDWCAWHVPTPLLPARCAPAAQNVRRGVALDLRVEVRRLWRRDEEEATARDIYRKRDDRILAAGLVPAHAGRGARKEEVRRRSRKRSPVLRWRVLLTICNRSRAQRLVDDESKRREPIWNRAPELFRQNGEGSCDWGQDLGDKRILRCSQRRH